MTIMMKPAEQPEHPVVAAMRRAPRADVLTLEQRAELGQDLEDIEAGRVQLVGDEEREAWYADHAEEIAALGPLDE